MSKKYVIEMKSEYEDTIRGIMVLGARDSNLYTDALAVEDMEELNSDYINEHFGDLQDTAYQKGYADGRMVGIKDGMCEAWEVARKIIRMPEGDMLNIFTECYSAVCTALQVLLKYDASEAIAKLKAYEEKQKEDDKIEVGDEVVDSSGKKGLVVSDGNKCSDTIWLLINGYRVPQSVCKEDYTKTGRHFDIASILEAMKA